MKPPVRRTLGSRLSSAEICRRNGWKRGTVLQGKKLWSEETIRITAVGESEVLAVDVTNNLEGTLDLRLRNWRRVASR